MSPLQRLIARIEAEHEPGRGAGPARIAACEERIGFSLPPDLRNLLEAANGIRFWSDGSYPCEMLAAEHIDVVADLFESDEATRSIVAVLALDSDYVGIELDPAQPGYGSFIDCSHETFPYELFAICDSVEELLTLVLDSQDEEWAWPAARENARDFANPMQQAIVDDADGG
ncbi:MAG: SMI1/KNR4 family protein [Acidimicrobiales bacterium]|nr:SMI1/KNR4 family protein [Acidimicrobiales bacterium]